MFADPGGSWSRGAILGTLEAPGERTRVDRSLEAPVLDE